ncbi:MAG: hypothetical protein HY067_19025 [Betaproteobacteria bacterium]|nr:hypothetical protein [Betaproteobacteria bacterium]
MNHLRFAIFLLLVSCGALLGGCTQGNSGDEAAAGTAAVPLGLDRFLLFPNPIVEPSGNFQTDTNAFAQAYYAAVDPFSERNTLASWKNKNQFGTGAQEFVAVFRDVRDLGYGRRMTGRRNSDGSIAFFVENYNVSNVPGGYSQVNVDAAVVRDPTWHVGTNAIEWSPAQCTASDSSDCDITVNFTKYFNFDPTTGQRQNTLNLDGRGLKSMPGICISCHGGRADPLTPQSTYALVENALSRKRGDVQARLQAFNVDSFEWATTPGFTRADQESVLKIFNEWVLCSYPGGGTVNVPGGTCTRPTAGANEWQGTAAALIQNWYGGAALPNAQFSDTYLPAGWNTGATNVQLYQQVVAPFCRTCHLLRGTANQSDIDFDSEAKFRSYASRIKAHVFDRGNMPLAFLVYQDFWKSNGPSILASYIDSILGVGTATTSSGAAKQPGRPIAEPGPNRMVRTGFNARLYGGDSLFATSYSWTLDASTPGAAITNPNSQTATFLSAFPNTYIVHLTVSNGAQSDSKTVNVVVNDTFRDPANLRFAHVKDVLQNGSTCTTCHLPSALPQPAATPPIWYTDFDRNFSGGAGNSIDDDWFYSEIMGRVNLTEFGESPLLRKPTGKHHNGGTLFDLATAGGLSNFSIIYNWILYGAQSGGAVANASATSSTTVTFSGSPLSANISLSGTQSVGTGLTYLWSIVSAPVSVFPAPSISNSTTATPTLVVHDVGNYVVQLQVTGGGFTDTVQLPITVTENPITAGFTPTNGSTVPIAALPTGIVLTNTSTGSPTTCQWQIVSGAGASLTSTTSCTTTTLNVSALGTYQIMLTVSNIGSSNTTHSIIVTSGTPVAANIVVSGGASQTRSFSGGTPSSGTPSTATVPVSLNSTGSNGLLPLTFAWSITSQPDGTNGAASFSNASSSAPTLTIRATGSYTVRLDVTDAASNTTFTTSTFSIAPSNGITFSTVAGTFPSVSPACTGCHSGSGADPGVGGGAPSWQNVTGSDGRTLWGRVIRRVNLGTASSSLLLVCPNAGCGAMGAQTPFSSTASGSNYDNFLKWIQDGAPPGN